jgi:hypothetical protein
MGPWEESMSLAPMASKLGSRPANNSLLNLLIELVIVAIISSPSIITLKEATIKPIQTIINNIIPGAVEVLTAAIILEAVVLIIIIIITLTPPPTLLLVLVVDWVIIKIIRRSMAASLNINLEEVSLVE